MNPSLKIPQLPGTSGSPDERWQAEIKRLAASLTQCIGATPVALPPVPDASLVAARAQLQALIARLPRRT